MLVEPLLRKFTYHLDRERGLSLRTQENYNRSLGAVLDRIDRALRRRPGIVRKGLELHHLTRARLQREIGRSPDGSVRIVACAVRAFFRFLLLRGVIKDDIGQRLLGRQVKRERSRFFTEAQAFRLLDSPRIKTPQTRQQEVQAVRDCALLAIMYEAGLRSGEVCGLGSQRGAFSAWGCTIPRLWIRAARPDPWRAVLDSLTASVAYYVSVARRASSRSGLFRQPSSRNLFCGPGLD